MTNPYLSLWLSSADAWGLLGTEIRRKHTQTFYRMSQQAIHFWTGTWWMFPAPRCRQRPVAERMAALSLRVVEGGRRR